MFLFLIALCVVVGLAAFIDAETRARRKNRRLDAWLHCSRFDHAWPTESIAAYRRAHPNVVVRATCPRCDTVVILDPKGGRTYIYPPGWRERFGPT